MVRKPSERSKSYTRPVDLNLIPYMDIVFSLVAFILFTQNTIKIGILNVNTPRYSDPLLKGAEPKNQDEEKKQLNLTVGIMYNGLYIAGVGGVLGQKAEESESKEAQGPTIPLLTRDPACLDHLKRNLPPPIGCYDYAQLTQKMVQIKSVEDFKSETKIIIYAQPDVPYEVLIKVMDATREYRDEEGERRSLFFDVLLSPYIG